MLVNLRDIFFYLDKKELENSISKLLDTHNVQHGGYHLYNDSKSLNISDDEGKHYMGTMLSNSKRSYYPIDVINILTQFYIRQHPKKRGYCFEFVRDCCDIILVKINLPLFKFEGLYTEGENQCVNFILAKNQYKMTILANTSSNSINTLKVFINLKEKSTDEDKLLPIIRSKPLKIYGNPYIDILYQMILYAHYFISYIKGNVTWDLV